jgi:hypothetical protein
VLIERYSGGGLRGSDAQSKDRSKAVTFGASRASTAPYGCGYFDCCGCEDYCAFVGCLLRYETHRGCWGLIQRSMKNTVRLVPRQHPTSWVLYFTKGRYTSIKKCRGAKAYFKKRQTFAFTALKHPITYL